MEKNIQIPKNRQAFKNLGILGIIYFFLDILLVGFSFLKPTSIHRKTKSPSLEQ